MAAVNPIDPQTAAAAHPGSYVDWPAVLAGAALATAISFVLLTFGSGLGLSLTSPYPDEGVSIFWLTIATAIWVLWVEISSFMAGAYLTGRMRKRVLDATEDEVHIRDGSHGLIMWAVAVLLGALIAAWGVTGVVNTATKTVSAASSAAASAAPAVADAADSDTANSLQLAVDRALRSSGAQSTGEMSEGLRQEAMRLFGSVLRGEEIDATDRDYLVNALTRQSGLSAEEAEQRIATLTSKATELANAAREAADKARIAGVIAAFLLAASLLVSAAGAYLAAGYGGSHRDEGTVFPHWKPIRGIALR